MKKISRFVVIAIAVFAVVLAGLAVLLKVMFPPERIKALAVEKIALALHREVKLGDAGVGLFSGVTLSGLEISERPTFAQGVFLTCQSLQLRLAWLPLLRKQVVVNEINIVQPDIRIVRLVDGKTFNFSDLTAAPGATTAKAATLFSLPEAYAAETSPSMTPAQTNSLDLHISHLTITKGTLHFVDQSPARQSAEVTQLEVQSSNLSRDGAFPLQLSGNIAYRGLSATVGGSAILDLHGDSADLKHLELSSVGTRISLNGKVQGFSSQNPKVNVQGDIQGLNVAALRPVLGLPKELEIEGGAVTGHVSIQGDRSAADFAFKIDLSAPSVVFGKQFSKGTQTPLKVDLTGQLLNVQTLKLSSANLTVGPLQAVLKGVVEHVDTPTRGLNLKLETNSFAVPELLRLFPAVSVPSTVHVTQNAKLSSDITGSVGSKMMTINLPNLAFVLGDLRVAGPITYSAQGVAASISAALRTNTFSLESLAQLVPMLQSYSPQGQSSLIIDAKGAMADPAVKGSFTLQHASLRYMTSEVTALNTAGTFTQSDVNLPKIVGKLNGSDFGFKLAAHSIQTHPRVELSGALDTLDLDKLLPPNDSGTTKKSAWISSWVGDAYAAGPATAELPMDLSGKLNITKIKHQYYQAQNLVLNWNLTNVTPSLAAVSGTATLQQGPGILKDVERLAAQSSLVRILLQPLLAIQSVDKNGLLQKWGLPSLASIPFTGIHGDYLLHLGVMDIKTFELIGRDLEIQTKGTVGLAGAQPLALQMSMRLAAGLIGGTVGALLQDSSGRTTLNFAVNGSVPSPKVQLQTQQATQRLLQGAGQQLLKSLGVGSGNSGSSNAQPSDNSKSENKGTSADDIQQQLRKIFH